MRQYLNLLTNILELGEDRVDRTGVGTRAIFGAQMRFELDYSFPLVTTKRVFFRGVVEELLWMLSGSTNVQPLKDRGVRIWDEWANAENGELGPVYGKQWRRWEGHEGHIDQIQQVLDSLVNNPKSRRHIVSAWNVADVDSMALPPCHMMFQFYVSNRGRLSCHMYQRSADMFLGVPFNIASYALLTMMVAQVTGLRPGTLIWSGGDVHIYRNHLQQVQMQIDRTPKALPRVLLNREVSDLFAFKAEDIELRDYFPHPAIKGEVAV